MTTAAEARETLGKLGIKTDGEGDAYAIERLRHVRRFRWDGETFVADQLPSESMAAGISQAELEEICKGQKTSWSNGNEITEAQRKAACAAMSG